jgi:uncharacterized membrane protein
MRLRLVAHVRRRLIQGVVLVLPLVVTLWLLGLLFQVINNNVTPVVRGLLEWAGMPGLERSLARLGVPLLSLLLTLGSIYLLGLIGGNLAGRRLLLLVESWILRIPLVKGIYGSARQLLDAFSVTGAKAFSKVVLVPYPRAGLWTLGFVTTEAEHLIEDARRDAVATVPVFLPTTPNPTSGWMVLVPTSELRVLDVSVEDAVKLIVSGGLVGPPDIGSLIRSWPGTSSPTPP